MKGGPQSFATLPRAARNHAFPTLHPSPSFVVITIYGMGRRWSGGMAHIGKLSTLKVKALIREGKPGRYGDGGGLYLQISRYGGSASWLFRYRVGGRLRDLGLGSINTWTLKEARERARRFRQLRGDGIDPIEQRREQQQAAQLDPAKVMTFRQCAEAYIAAHRAGWKSSVHAAQWPATLGTYAFPTIGDLPVRRSTPGSSCACSNRSGLKAGDRVQTARPDRGGARLGDGARLSAGRKPGTVERAISKTCCRPAPRCAASSITPRCPIDEMPDFMAELRPAGRRRSRALEFAILTAARTGEVIGALWDEFDLTERLWTIPAERMKAGREHRVPLS